jgi:asparagine synthase (glutamine-hydrolysing)
MTALAGYWHFAGAEGAGRVCARMLAAQTVYGEEDGSWDDGAGVALGRRIYRRLPEDRHDRGPARSAASGTVLVADVRLDNREDLASELRIDRGELGRTCDAQLVAAALDRWGDAALDRLVGDFAFAAWLPREQKLLLARDPVGNRPLHYHRGEAFFAFATMPKGLHALPEVPYALNIARVADFLALTHSVGPETFFSAIERVQAGHAVSVTRVGLDVRRYWNPPLTPLRLSSEDYVQAAREALDRSVAVRLRGAGATVASHLSAGLDSSAVTATAARLIGAGGGGVAAFTAVPGAHSRRLTPPGRFADESSLASATASHYENVEHILVPTPGRSPLDSLDRHFFLHDRPRLNLCNALWLDAIEDEAHRRGHVVLLTAQFGNLSLSYSGQHLLPELLGSGRLFQFARQIWGLLSRGMHPRSIAAAAFAPFLPRHLWKRLARARGKGGPDQYSAINRGAACEQGLHERAARAGLDLAFQPGRHPAEVRLGDLRRFDSGVANKASLARCGLDVRDPMTDRRLIELCLRIPTDEFLRHGELRSLARRVLSDRVPRRVLDERARGFQCGDWPELLDRARDEIAQELGRCAHVEQAASVIDFAQLDEQLSRWPEEWQDERLIAQYRFSLLRAVSAAHFVRRVAGANR